jgi:adenosine deaminase
MPNLESYRATSERINPLVKNPGMAYLSAHLFALEAITENVRYAEYRMNPEGQGDSPETIVRLVEEGFRDAMYRLERSRKKMDYGIIILAPRMGDETLNPETGNKVKVDKAVQLAKLAVELRQKGYSIVGVDLAGDEMGCPVTDFKPFFDVIHRHNASAPPEQRLGITIHSGETEQSGHLQGWESIRESIQLGTHPNTPLRIGHGVQIIHSSPYLEEAFDAFLNDPDNWEKRFPKAEILKHSPLLKEVIDRKICLEMCPKSNIQTRAVENYRRHPAVFLSRLGVQVSISSDNRTISNSDNTNDYVKLYKYAGATYEDRKRMVLSGLQSAFIFDPEKRKALFHSVLSEFEKMERDPTLALAIYKEKYRVPNPSLLTKFRLALWCELQDMRHEVGKFIDQLKVDTLARFRLVKQWLGQLLGRTTPTGSGSNPSPPPGSLPHRLA